MMKHLRPFPPLFFLRAPVHNSHCTYHYHDTPNATRVLISAFVYHRSYRNLLI